MKRHKGKQNYPKNNILHAKFYTIFLSCQEYKKIYDVSIILPFINKTLS